MLNEFDDALRKAAQLVSDIDRDVRQKLHRVKGREERFSEKFVTLLDERLDGYSNGGVAWSTETHVSDKQSGQEQAVGSDFFISLNLNFKGIQIQKGIQVQAKVNQHTKYGLRVDSKPKLLKQCEKMLTNSDSSFVFVYGERDTKILSAQSVVDSGETSLTNLITRPVQDFFYDFFVCREGDRRLHSHDNVLLQSLVTEFQYAAVAKIMAKGE